MASGKNIGFGAVLGAIGIIAGSPSTSAQAQSRRIAFNIPAGTMDAALRAYARATGIQILYRPEAVEAMSFRGLEETLEADVALQRILLATGLVVRRPAAGVVVLSAEGSGRSVGVARAETQTQSIMDQSADDIVVTGSNVRGGVLTAPVRTIGRREFATTGRATVAEAIAAQPGNFGGTGNPIATLTGADRATINSSMAPAANLRGLGSDATLTLFDGRRVAGSGGRGDFTDLSNVPTLAVERVEILSDGASAIYGSDAVGGVVNILLRHRIRGIEGRARGGVGTDGTLGTFIGGLAAGTTWSTGSILAAYEFEHRDALASADRRYAVTGDLRPFGGTDHRSYQSSPATILSYSAAARAYLPAFAVPILPAGRQPVLGDLVPGANLSSLFAGLDLSPRVDRHSVYARAGQSIGTSLDLFADVRYSHRTFGYASPAASTIFLVTAANPYFLPVDGQTSTAIGYSFYREAGPVKTAGRVRALSTTAGLTWQAPARWTIDAYGSYSRETSGETSTNTLNATLLNEALGASSDIAATSFSTGKDGFFNPYTAGSNAPALIDFVTSGFSRARRRSSLADGNIKAEGPVLQLAGGDVRLAIGGAIRRETFASAGETFTSGVVPTQVRPLEAWRTVQAAFGEMAVPLISAANARAGARSLDLSLAVRHERYGDVGSTTNPKFGLAYRPVKDLLLRTSWGTSFRAPALTEVNARRTISPTSLPDAAGVYRPTIFVSGGNTDLSPERAKTLSGGFVLTPTTVPGLRMEVNLFSTRFEDRIAQPVLQDILRALTSPALASFVQLVQPVSNAADLARVQALLAEPGAGTSFVPASAYVAIADGRFVNTSTLTVSGLDYDLGYGLRSGRNRFDVALAATWLFTYSERLTPTSARAERLDTVSNPVGLKARLTGSWERGGTTFALIGNYVDGYVDDASSRRRAIRPFATLDATLGYSPRSGPLKTFRASFVVQNAFDASPPFVDRSNGIGFDGANASPFGRTFALEFARGF